MFSNNSATLSPASSAASKQPSAGSTSSRNGTSPARSSTRGARKSPPPPRLNLEDCKPILPRTTNIASYSSAPGSSTAFVFTSSRTLRSLRAFPPAPSDPLLPAAHIEPISPVDSNFASTSHLRTSPISPTSHTHRSSKATLSPTLLARHSQGAVDAKSIVSHNMRAAGFVPLSHTPLNPPGNSVPATPGSTVSTPADPPLFPPMIFINPTNLTTMPMWDYQRAMDIELSIGSPGSFTPFSGDRSTSAKSKSFMSSPASPPSDASNRVSQPSSSFSPSSLGSSRSPAFFSMSALSSQTSFTSISSSGTKRRRQTAERYIPPVDGYPFPSTPPRAPHASFKVMASPSIPVPEAITKSPSTAASTASGSITPLAPSPILPISSLPSLERASTSVSESSSSSSGSGSVQPASTSVSEESSSSGSGSGSLSPASSSCFVRQPIIKSRDGLSVSRVGQSLTELWSTSPCAWTGDPGLLPPVESSTVRRESTTVRKEPTTVRKESTTVKKESTTVRKESTRGRSRTTASRTASGRADHESKKRSKESKAVQTTINEDEQKLVSEKPPVAEVIVENQLPEVQIEVPRPEKVTPLWPLQELDEDELLDEVQREKAKLKEEEKEKEKEKHRGREKDHEKRRHKAKSTTSQSHSSSSPTSTTSSHGREDKKGKGKEHASRKGKDRTRPTKEKALAYSSFSFPPREARVGSHIHTLGGRDPALERERERAAAAQAKDIVLAHRERDRAHARQTEAWQAEKDGRGTHKKRASGSGLLRTHVFASAYDAGRGRGLGRGRGEHASIRGRSTSAFSVASSIISESETMVHEQPDIIIEPLVEEVVHA